MVRRRWILGGIALVGAGVVVCLIVSGSERNRRELAGYPGHAILDSVDGPARASDPAAETRGAVDVVKAGTASTKSTPSWTLRGRLLRYPDSEALEPTLPVVGALLGLTLSPRSESKPDFVPREVRSGPEGRFEITGVPGKAEYRLLVDAAGCALQTLSLELPRLEEPRTKQVPDIVLEEPERLVVIVKGPQNRLMDGATVKAVPEWAPGNGLDEELDLYKVAIEAEPRGEGEYVFERLSRGFHRIEASLRGTAGNGARVSLPRSEVLKLVLRKGESISGTVRTTAGEPIPDARVWDDEDVTDDQGRFLLQGLSCTDVCFIRASAEGFCEVFASIQGPEADIVLPRESTLSGHVLTASGREPIAGAKVKCGEDGDEVSTDGSGAFTLKKVPPGSREIYVQNPLYLPLVSDPWELGEGEQISDIELELESGLSVKGRVLSTATGDPIQGATVSARLLSEKLETRETVCQSSGSFELNGLRGEEYRVTVSAAGFLETETKARVPTSPGEEWTFTIEPEGRIHGRILDPNGKAVAGARVHLSFRGNRAPEFLGRSWEKEVLTDSRGTYELPGVPPHDDHCLVAGIDHKLAIAWLEGIALAPGERKEIDIRFPRGGTLRGRVRTPGSFAPSDVSITAVSSTPLAGGLYVSTSLLWGGETTRPLASGDFELKQLPPGTYTVLVSSEWCRPQDFSVDLEEGSERFLDILLEEGLSVSGKVVEAGGKPVEGVDLTVWLPGANAFATSDEDGLFTARGLPAGRGAISAFLFGVESTVVCDIPSSGNVVNVGTTALVSGRVEARGRKAAPESAIEFLRWTGGGLEQVQYVTTDEASRFRAALSPGMYLVRATAEAFASPRLEIELRPGERREIVIEIVQGGSVEVLLELEGADSGGGWLCLESPASAPVCEESDFPGETIFEGVPAGLTALVAVVHEHGLARKEGVLVTAGSNVRVELTVPRTQGIFGRVTRRGEPVDGMTVHVRGPSGPQLSRTSMRGWYQLEGLAPGDHEIHVEDSRRTARVVAGKATRLDIELAAVLVSGSVRVGGQPAAGVPVESTCLLDASDNSTRTNDDGQWSLDLLAPGEYAIVAGGVHRNLVLKEGQSEATVAFELETLPPPEEEEEEEEEDDDNEKEPEDED